MKKLNNTFAAVAVALGLSLTPHAHAIEMETNGVGDTLLFPVFAGQFENYFTVSNGSNSWIQGHLRFRGAAWSAELLDFDVILSPGDVLVFRLADVDGDGAWEIDASLDTETFQHTGMIFSCAGPSGTFTPCIESSNLLEPEEAALTGAGIKNAADLIGMQRTWGYAEFIGEAVLNGMTKDIMKVLESGNPGTTWQSYVTSNGNKKGTNTWRWSDADGGHRACPNSDRCDRGISDVPNVLSGTAFITVPGQVGGMAYNAEALVDFRTSSHPHRIDNYVNTAVILHHEDASSPANAISPAGDYVYSCCTTADENRDDEVVISFNNTWGPTLADGDDYLPTSVPGFSLVPSLIPGLPIGANSVANSPIPGDDAFDALRRPPAYGSPDLNQPFRNSITEVEMAVRNASVGQNDVFSPVVPGALRGQIFTSYYFDNGTPDRSAQSANTGLGSMFLAYFPTKFYYGENIARARGTGMTLRTYINNTVVDLLLRVAKQINVEVWDIGENPCSCTGASSISPAPIGGLTGAGGAGAEGIKVSACKYVLGQELNVFDIAWLKAPFTDSNCANYTSGRTVIALTTNRSETPLQSKVDDGFPGLLYTFERTKVGNFTNWRSMQKR